MLLVEQSPFRVAGTASQQAAELERAGEVSGHWMEQGSLELPPPAEMESCLPKIGVKREHLQAAWAAAVYPDHHGWAGRLEPLVSVVH